MRTIFVIAALLIMAAPTLADNFTEDFENGNADGWSFGNSADAINPEGGNPGAWLGNDYLNTFAPICRNATGEGNFSGNYVTMGVTQISGDFRTDRADNGTQYYPFTLVLRNVMGTPNDIEDDIIIYQDPDYFGTLCPQLDAGWTHYDFAIPSDFVGGPGELPEGWLGGSYMSGNDVFPADALFQEVLSDISKLEFWWFHPAWFGIYTWWETGADNISIDTDGGTVATESTTLSGIKALYR